MFGTCARTGMESSDDDEAAAALRLLAELQVAFDVEITSGQG